MNDNQYNSQNTDNGQEKIHFDNRDFQNPYSQYYAQKNEPKRQEEPTDRDFSNPYSKYYGKTDVDENEKEKIDLSQDFNADGTNAFQNTYEKVYDFVYEEPDLLRAYKAKRNFTRIGIGYALFSSITFAVTMIIARLVYMLSPEFYNTTLFMNAITPVALYIFALPVLLIILSGSESKPPEKRKMSAKAWFMMLLVAFGCMYIGSYIGNFVMAYLSEIMNYDYSNGLNSIIDNEKLWITAIFTVIVAPIGEEIVFRKLIIDRTQKYGAFVSIGLSALMFGLMHGNFYQFFYCFALGIILGYIYYTTGNVWLTIAMHAVINFVGGILSSFLLPVAEGLETLDVTNMDAVMQFVSENIFGLLLTAAFSLFMTATMACAVIFPIVFRKKITFERGEEEIAPKSAFRSVILNVGIIIMLVVYLLEFGLNLLPL